MSDKLRDVMAWRERRPSHVRIRRAGKRCWAVSKATSAQETIEVYADLEGES